MMENKEVFESIVNSSNDAILCKTLDGKIISWNPAAKLIFGYEEEEMLNNNISILIPPNLLDEEKMILEKICNGEKIKHYETERVRKDGTSVYVSLTISPLKNSSGVIIGASKIIRDITDKKSIEENLNNFVKEISDYKFALDQSAIVAITDRKGIIQHVNDNFCRISKYSKEELIGQDHRIINSGFHSAEFIKSLWTTIASGTIWKGELKNKAKDGTIYWVDTTIVPFLNEMGKPYQYLAIRSDITDRKLTEEKLKASEIYYHSVIEQASDMIYIIDASDPPKIIDINQSGCNLLGYNKEEILKLTIFDIIFVNDYSNSASRIEDIRAGKAIRIERKIRKKDGSSVEIEASAKKLHDGNIMVVARDISERKKVEEKLAANEKRLRTLVENNYDVISLLDKNLKAIYRSPSATRIMGWTDEEYDKLDGTLNTHPDDRDYAQDIVRIAHEKPSQPIQVCFRRLHKNGHYLWLEGSITNLLNDEQINAYVTNFRDITAYKLAEEKLKLSETYYRSIIEQATDMIYITDPNITEKFIDINPSGCKMLGYTKDEFLKLKPLDIIFDEDLTVNPIMIRELKFGDEIRNERRLKRKDGTAVETESSGKMLDDGKFIVFARDITDRKKTEKEIIALNENLEARVKERTFELEAFSYSVSHDLRAPLRAVNGYAQMLHEDYGPQFNEEGNRILQNIKCNAVKMGVLIDDLLAFSRIGRKEVQKREVDLNEMLEAIIIDLNKTSNHHTTIKFDNLHKVKADYGLLYQAVYNIVANGVKYSSKKEKPQIVISSKQVGDEVIISFKDNGAGFDMLYAEKLFGVFQRLHTQEEFEGTGVGLAIVQRIIAKHNGRVWAEGIVDTGATFYISLINN